MRQVTQEEVNLAQKVAKRKGRNSVSRQLLAETIAAKKAVVSYQQDGAFTKAVIKTTHNLYVGVAKRNPQDSNAVEIGRNIAFSRAVKSKPIKL